MCSVSLDFGQLLRAISLHDGAVILTVRFWWPGGDGHLLKITETDRECFWILPWTETTIEDRNTGNPVLYMTGVWSDVIVPDEPVVAFPENSLRLVAPSAIVPRLNTEPPSPSCATGDIS